MFGHFKKLIGKVVFIFILTNQAYAETNMRIVCLTGANQPDPSELMVIEFNENQSWELSDLVTNNNSFPLVATREPHTFRVTHYNNIHRRNNQTLYQLAQTMTPSQMRGEPMLIEGRMLGPMFAFTTTAPYLTADGRAQSPGRRHVRLSYAQQRSGEDYPVQIGFTSGFTPFSINQASCTPPYFYTVGENTTFVPPANESLPDNNTTPPARK